MELVENLLPHIRLRQALDVTKKFYGRFAFEVIEPDIAARFLNYTSANNGAYKRKVADLRAYGLLTPRGKIQVSNLGKRATFPNDEQEKENALLEAFTAVDLYKRLFERYRKNLPDQLWPDLIKWTGAKPDDAQGAQQKIRELYLTDIRDINVDVQKSRAEAFETDNFDGGGKPEPRPKNESDAFKLEDKMLGKLTTKFGTIMISNKATVEIARSYLNLIEKEFTGEEADSNQ